MEDSILKFIEQNNAQESFEDRLTSTAMGHVLGGENVDTETEPCDPWSSCDAWNCNPDCRCKSVFC